SNIINVPEQDVVSGDFPSVHSPNPEEPAALELAIRRAEETGADLVMATDPDADRVGIAVRDHSGKMILLNGNQTASLLIYYLLRRWKESGKLDGSQFIAKTIVTTDLLSDIASGYGVASEEVLTGFKYIAEIIRENEGVRTFIGGGEESYGYLIGDYVRDKDAVISCCMIAETAAWAREQGMTLYGLLLDIYKNYGLYVERLLSITRKGKKGAEEIQEMLKNFRQDPPLELHGEKVIRIIDYQDSTDRNMESGSVLPIKLPRSNVLQFITREGSKITVRPSGTEPKIKFYFAVKADPQVSADPESGVALMDARIEGLKSALNLG
ncbi:MAG: phospho-sugar mutase, partial [Bacteroidales bacterium]|nr:phospho-sugar mutase [Bacteroidales bacterium]